MYSLYTAAGCMVGLCTVFTQLLVVWSVYVQSIHSCWLYGRFIYSLYAATGCLVVQCTVYTVTGRNVGLCTLYTATGFKVDLCSVHCYWS